MSGCWEKTKILFISESKLDIRIRNYNDRDFEDVYGIYSKSFAEDPWNEYMKCGLCGINYGIYESRTAKQSCKKCNGPLKLEEYWSRKDVYDDIGYAMSVDWRRILVAEMNGKLAGFTWGYRMNREKFGFLSESEVLSKGGEIMYVDEVATSPDCRNMGIATMLETVLLSEARNSGFSYAVLRTDEKNKSAISVYEKLGFRKMKASNGELKDPEFTSRIYMAKPLVRYG